MSKITKCKESSKLTKLIVCKRPFSDASFSIWLIIKFVKKMQMCLETWGNGNMGKRKDGQTETPNIPYSCDVE